MHDYNKLASMLREAYTEEQQTQDLLEVLKGVDTSESSGYCNCDYRSGHPSYYDWERNVAEPALEQLGYTNVVFTNGECDSFGPLSRCVYATKDNQRFTFYYG